MDFQLVCDPVHEAPRGGNRVVGDAPRGPVEVRFVCEWEAARSHGAVCLEIGLLVEMT